MALWSIGGTTGEDRPKWLYPDQIKHHYDPNMTWADMKGWNVTHESGNDELIVAVPGLSNSLLSASIVALEWGDGTYLRAGTQTVVVVYNEQIVPTAHPTLIVTASISGDVTATHTSTSKNKLTFTFTIPNAANVLSIGAQNIIGVINDGDGNLATSSLVISSDVALAIFDTPTKIVV
jgi:hypothetical protein